MLLAATTRVSKVANYVKDMKSMSTSDEFKVGPVKSWELYAYGLARTIVHFVNKVAWRVEVIGSERIPKGPFILAPVHRSNLDTPLVASVTRRRMRYMGKDGVWKLKPFGALLSALGGFPVHRGATDRDAMRRCLAVLANNEPLVLFPEGTRNTGSRIEGVHEGAAYIAAKANVPIVPIGIGGSERAWGKDMKFPRFTKIVLWVGEPIYPEEILEAKVGNHIPKSSLRNLTNKLISEMQTAYDSAEEILSLKDNSA